MAILNNTPDIKKHVAVAKSFVFEDLQPYILKAVNKFTRKYVGNLHIILADPATEGANMAVLNEARDYLQAALANFGMYLYTPVGSIMIDGSGMSTSTSDNRASLSWGQKKDIQREFLSAGHEAMDLLLACMEGTPAAFPAWVASMQYTQNKELLVNNTATFNKYYNIYESRQTYLALQPAIRQVEDQYLSTLLCPELITFLKNSALTNAQLQVKENLQKAIVAYTIAKVADEGIFSIDAASIKLKFDVLPDDKVQSPDAGKPADWLTNTVKKQTANGNNYLDTVVKIITANISQFNQCSVPIIVANAAAAPAWEPYNTQSTLGL